MSYETATQLAPELVTSEAAGFLKKPKLIEKVLCKMLMTMLGFQAPSEVLDVHGQSIHFKSRPNSTCPDEGTGRSLS